MILKLCSVLFVCIFIVGCVQPVSFRYPTKNYKSYVSSSVEEKSYVSATVSDKELISAFEDVVKEDPNGFIAGWITPRGELSSGITLKDEEGRKRLNDALNSTPLGSEAKWKIGNVSFVLTPNSKIYTAYKSGGICRDAFLLIYDNVSEDIKRGLFCKKGIASNWLKI